MSKAVDPKKEGQAQADQLFKNAPDHAPVKSTRLDIEAGGGKGAPIAQGMNLSKEEEEFAANAKEAGVELPEEKTPASKEA